MTKAGLFPYIQNQSISQKVLQYKKYFSTAQLEQRNVLNLQHSRDVQDLLKPRGFSKGDLSTIVTNEQVQRQV